MANVAVMKPGPALSRAKAMIEKTFDGTRNQISMTTSPWGESESGEKAQVFKKSNSTAFNILAPKLTSVFYEETLHSSFKQNSRAYCVIFAQTSITSLLFVNNKIFYKFHPCSGQAFHSQLPPVQVSPELQSYEEARNTDLLRRMGSSYVDQRPENQFNLN